jgi:hypothetical protein
MRDKRRAAGDIKTVPDVITSLLLANLGRLMFRPPVLSVTTNENRELGS